MVIPSCLVPPVGPVWEYFQDPPDHMDQPPQSPDLNPTEDLWDVLEKVQLSCHQFKTRKSNPGIKAEGGPKKYYGKYGNFVWPSSELLLIISEHLFRIDFDYYFFQECN